MKTSLKTIIMTIVYSIVILFFILMGLGVGQTTLILTSNRHFFQMNRPILCSIYMLILIVGIFAYWKQEQLEKS